MPNSPLILSGKEVSLAVKSDLKDRIAKLKEKGVAPGLTAVLVGEDPASQVYVRSKERQSGKLGFNSQVLRLDENTSQTELLQVVKDLNEDDNVHGILVQLPLPKHIDSQLIIEAIEPNKDVDGFHPVSVGKLVLDLDGFVSCTPAGILEIMKYYKIETSGKHVVVVGRSNIVGKPMANLMIQKKALGNATVTLVHTRTPDMGVHTRQADILIAAAGVPEFITEDMVKAGAVVIDVGINRVDDASTEKGYRLVGDVDFAGVSEKCTAITPVPGGVGPMTIAMLLSNTVKSAENSLK
ncbi:MAG: bifunctional methylenetetrahydrofolate dehydrogenase/methenyltetrahydrofolate cyclohydrolase FolD [Candidatus Marinimicrobia bacterium]|nr:bifunctional methylenetetrahydrofolate dehydrogenase/methenyltetrahydrofolate cyclohydrolase FolD [Candidatus Neomarinimicrobiota bacterium]MBT4295553.1 bifunctional methylenetetrahydrofolate dehydrogenase/methenyltetrahydrofolate cyclohydrolase FolD [Candidatus Neomarinimicrobiota bacterium]MBT5314967.1 bifunctional methylenetetrahydrofolate dehydrogenase/methenyltetrahydrofolate cyclohydrolase FolD [Candidatus Neomarinimicrobiota bacterium]MBT5467675.1 bifunctional methylenetetrahydrofolate